MCLFVAKKVVLKTGTTSISKPDDLVTTRDQTRAGFISMALEKNYMAVPYIAEARALKILAEKVSKPKDLLKVTDLRVGLLTASGLSEKSLNYLEEKDKDLAILGLIEKFLEPAGAHFSEELVYRYLLTKGDALGGKARNLAGTLGERKVLRSLLSVFNLSGIAYKWKDCDTQVWLNKPQDDIDIEKRIAGLHWMKNGKGRILLMNVKVGVVGKNVDLILLNGNPVDKFTGKSAITKNEQLYIALGELKGGIDPAGADEHWKTAKTALTRIRKGFDEEGLKPHTFFIGAAIEKSMAIEMFDEIKKGILNNAANLTNDLQLTEISKWIIDL